MYSFWQLLHSAKKFSNLTGQTSLYVFDRLNKSTLNKTSDENKYRMKIIFSYFKGESFYEKDEIYSLYSQSVLKVRVYFLWFIL